MRHASRGIITCLRWRVKHFVGVVGALGGAVTLGALGRVLMPRVILTRLEARRSRRHLTRLLSYNTYNIYILYNIYNLYDLYNIYVL